MKAFGFFFILFGFAVVIFPQILSYIIWWVFVFIWINFLFIARAFSGKNKWKDNYVKFGNYKIYR